MKKILFTTIVFLCSMGFAMAQCTPDDTYQDEGAGLYPLPDDTGGQDPTVGINETAEPGVFFDFVFTAVVPEEFEVSGIAIPLEYIKVEEQNAIRVNTDDNLAFEDLPTIEDFLGLTYDCNPNDCIFPQNSLGCAIISGTVNEDVTPGEYQLKIQGEAKVQFLPAISVTFPDPTLFPGEYVLKVQTTGVASIEHKVAVKQNAPNPFSGSTNIIVNADKAADYTFSVTNLFGQTVHTEVLNIVAGENTINFDASQLGSGVYTYTISDNEGVVTKRMVVQN